MSHVGGAERLLGTAMNSLPERGFVSYGKQLRAINRSTARPNHGREPNTTRGISSEIRIDDEWWDKDVGLYAGGGRGEYISVKRRPLRT